MPGIEVHRVHRVARAVAVAACIATAGVGLLAAPVGAAEEAGEPVKWDQARVTQYAVDLNAAVGEAVQAMRKSPIQTQAAQRIVWYELKEDLRLISNSTAHLQAELQAGEGADETRATFDRIGSLRLAAEEHGRRSMIPDPVMDALVKAGAVHNLMKPYFHGKR
jgi:hypothetical protein